MTHLKRTILRARRRDVLNNALHGGAVGLTAALGAAIALLVADRFFALGVPSVMFGVLALAGLVIGVGRAVAQHPDVFETALRIDRALHLKDRIATGCMLAEKSGGGTSAYASRPGVDPAFADIVRRDAESLAGRLDVRTLAPLRMTRAWIGVLLLAPLLTLGVLYLPTAAWADPAAPEPALDSLVAAEVERERERTRESLAETIDSLQEDVDPANDAARAELDALARLAEQLESDSLRPEDVRRIREESAARVSELAERLEQESERQRRAEEQLLERFAGIETPDAPMSAREFEDALKRGEFGAAGEELAEQLAARDEMSPDEKQSFADHLRAMEEELERLQREQREQAREQRELLEQQLQDQGLDTESIRDLLEQEGVTREDIERELRDLGLDDEALERLRRAIEQQRDENVIGEQVDMDTESIREALREAMRELDAADDPDRPDPLDEQPPDPHDEIDPADEPDDVHPDEREDDPQTPEREDEAVDEQPAERTETDEPAETDQQVEQAEREEAVAEAEAEAGEETAREGEPSDEDAPDAEPGAEPGADPDAAPDADATPGVDDAADDPAMEGAPSPDPDADEDGMAERPSDMHEPGMGECPSDRLHDLEQRRGESEQRRSRSEELRERVRHLLDEQSDPGRPRDQRELEERLREQLADSGVGGDDAGVGDERTPIDLADPAEPDREIFTEDIDLRDDEVLGELIAEWLSDEPREGEAGTTTRRLSDEQIRRAREIAERAVEDAAVPSRYHQRIRRFFSRLGETLEEAESSPE